MVCITNGLLLSHEKEWNLAICDNMDGPGEYHAKWNKSDGERKISIKKFKTIIQIIILII